MRALQVKEVEEINKDEVQISVKIKEKNEEETIVKRTDEWKDKLGRKKLNKEDKATERITLNFTKGEILAMENALKIEGINKDSRNGKALFIKKMLQRQMLRNGYDF